MVQSFTEYVRDSFFDKLYSAVTKFVYTANYAALDLRLARVKNIDDIELEETEILDAKVVGLSGDRVYFYVVMAATLLVHDYGFSAKGRSEKKKIRVKCQCAAELGKDLKDMAVKDVVLYNKKEEIFNEEAESKVAEFLRGCN